MVLPQGCLFLKQSPKTQINPTVKYHYASTMMTRIFLKTENVKEKGCANIYISTKFLERKSDLQIV